MSPILIEPDSEATNDSPSPKSGLELSLDGANLILKRHLGKSCINFELLNRGYNNQAYIVTDAEANEFVIRLSGRFWMKMKTEGEVAGILYLAAKCPEIPLPKILGFCSSRELSGVDAEYILMQKLPGKPLDEIWASMATSEKLAVSKEVTSIFVRIKKLKFDQLGSFLLPEATSNTYGLGLNIADINVDDIRIGEVMEQNVGPFATYLEFLHAICSREIEGLEKSVFMAPQMRNLTRIKAFVKEMTDPATTKFKPEIYNSVPFTFHHGDFESRNILLEDHKVTGIVDLEFSGSFPIDNEWIEGMGFLGVSTAEWRMFNEVPSPDSDTPDPVLIAPVRQFVLDEVQRLSPDILPDRIAGHSERALMYFFFNNICPWFLKDVDPENHKPSTLEDREAAIRRVEFILEKYGF